jgi:hypothetical protein
VRKLLVIFAIFLLSVLAHATLCPTNYGHVLQIAIPAESGLSADVPNFIMYWGGDANLKSTGNGGWSQTAGGLDVVFCGGVSALSVLPYELVANTYSATAGTGAWHIKVPNVSKTATQYIYAVVGKISASDLSSSPWTNFTLVQHLGNGSTLSATDSSASGWNGTITAATATAGPMGGAAAFVAANSAQIDDGVHNLAYSLARFSTVVKCSSVVGTAFTQWSNSSAGEAFILDSNGGSGHARFCAATSGNTCINGTSNTCDGAWHWLAGTWTTTGGAMKLYVDGAQQNTGTVSGSTLTNATSHILLGNYTNTSLYTGSEAEVRIGNSNNNNTTITSADWIKAEYLNQSAPSSFYTNISITPSFTTQPTVAWTSPSSIAASFATSTPNSVHGACGTASGGPYTAGYARSADNGDLYTQGWQRTDFTGTSSAYGHAVAITGLHQATTYYCVMVATDPTGTLSTTSAEFSATTGTLSTTPVVVNVVSKLTRLNDQYDGANGMPTSGTDQNGATVNNFYIDGDTELQTFADDGKYYGVSHDSYGVKGAYSNVLAWFGWNIIHTIANQIGGLLGFGPSDSPSAASGWTDGGDWETLGLQSVRGQIYYPMWRCWNSLSYCGDFNMLRSPDHLAHSISAGNQATQGLGPNSVLSAYADLPASPGVMPNNPTVGSLNNSSGTVEGWLPMVEGIQTCQDESINCTAQANDDGYVYAWGVTPGGVDVLTRIRVEDYPLMDASKYQVYTGANSGDDGIYDSSWSVTPSAGTAFGALGNPLSTQFIPDFNRFVHLEDLDNTYGSSVVLYDFGPYPWSGGHYPTTSATAIGSVSWDADQWPGYYVAFGQILPGSYVKTSTTPLGGLVMLTTTGTVKGFASGGNPAPSWHPNSYSPFIAKLSLTARTVTPPRSQVSAMNAPNTHIANGLDLFYDFRGTTSVSTSLPNLSPSDTSGAFSVGSSGFSATVAGAHFGYFSPKGMFSFGFPPQNGTIAQVITTPYNKTLTAFNATVVFEHANSTTATITNETVLAMGSFKIYRNGGTANSWYVSVGTATIGPFTLPTDGNCATNYVTCPNKFVALMVNWDGTNVNVYSSAQIPSNGATLPLTPLATGSNSTAVSGTLYLGAADASKTNPFFGTMSELVIFSRHLRDGDEKTREINALRYDMLSRGVVLP